MSSVSGQIECPKCGYEYADYDYECRVGNEHVSCIRCGFSGSHTIDVEKSKSAGKPVWETRESGGNGSFQIKWKGQIGCTVEPIDSLIMDRLKETLHAFEVCKYTYHKEGKWYVVDLLKNTEVIFSEGEFWGYEAETKNNQDDSTDMPFDPITWD